MKTKDDLPAEIRAERAGWHALLAVVGEGRMERPGPMGDWTYKDLAAHLTGWRERTIRRIEAGPGPEPPTLWPGHLTGDDAINAWIRERNRDRPLREVLAEGDASFARLATAVAALPDEDLTAPGRFAWLEGEPLVAADFFGHLHEEHEPAIRAWRARLNHRTRRRTGIVRDHLARVGNSQACPTPNRGSPTRSARWHRSPAPEGPIDRRPTTPGRPNATPRGARPRKGEITKRTCRKVAGFSVIEPNLTPGSPVETTPKQVRFTPVSADLPP